MTLAEFVQETCGQIDPSAEDLRQAAGELVTAMRSGLAGRTSSLRMLPSFIARPTGEEQGEAVAIDFGGTNVRILRVTLGGGRAERGGYNSFSLIDPSGTYDFTRPETRGEELFDFIARHTAGILAGGTSPLPLGHTFSFPCRQDGINHAVLIQWTKEIRTGGVEGRDVTPLLEEALRRQGVVNVHPRAVINDTVGTLLAAAYRWRNVDIGSICGTGHNTCYLEPNHPLTGKPMIVNMESGNFDGIRLTPYDREVNEASSYPGAQLLEKQVSGAYLGEVATAVLRRMVSDGLLPAGDRDWGRGSLAGADLTRILKDGSGLQATKTVAENRLALAGLSAGQLQAIRRVVRSVAGRSARLVGATYAGILRYLDAELEREHVIAIDGSLYEHLPGYDAGIHAALEAVLGPGASAVTTRLIKDGSGIGAAIAAIVAEGQR
jgi:hexokinase